MSERAQVQCGAFLTRSARVPGTFGSRSARVSLAFELKTHLGRGKTSLACCYQLVRTLFSLFHHEEEGGRVGELERIFRLEAGEKQLMEDARGDVEYAAVDSWHQEVQEQTIRFGDSSLASQGESLRPDASYQP